MGVQFSIGTFSAGGKYFPGMVIADRVYSISSVIPEVTSTTVLLSDWKSNFERLNEFAQDEQKRAAFDSTPVVDLQTLPPVTPTGQLIAAGANYRQQVIEITVAHQLGDPDASAEALREQAAQEVDERAQNGEPYVWIGSASGMSGAYDDVLLPEVGNDHDWELELGVVIGRDAYRVSEQDAMEYVAGYTICNDITTRSLVPRKDIPMMGTDWMRSKNHPTFFPTGPYIVPAAFVEDPHDLEIRLSLNGTPMQQGNTSDMVFNIPKLISYITSFMSLHPGDMVITGSPQGNGSHWGRFLQAGDVIEGSITGLGTQRNRVRDLSEGKRA